MGITIHYRGRIQDLDRVEEFEDRVLDMALATGALAQLWRSAADDNPTRVVRGMMLDLSPGQDTTSLLLSPEGWLVPLFDIKAAEKGTLEPSYCFVKTQFGSVEGHVALVELFTYLKREFFPDLEVIDEGGYWEHRDCRLLAQKLAESRAMIDRMADALEQNPLTSEAAESPEIVASRIERVAHQVHASLSRPPEHAPVRFDDEGPDWDDVDETHWDASFKEKRRRQEQMQRSIEEQLAGGADHDEALRRAIRDQWIVETPDEESDDRPLGEELAEELAGHQEDDDATWRASLPAQPESLQDDDDGLEAKRQQMQQASFDLHVRLFDLFQDERAERCSQVGTLMRGAGELMGGLAQALASSAAEADGLDRGLALVQLKRALRGAAFATGALYPLTSDKMLTEQQFEELRGELRQLQDGILEELDRVRQSR